MDDLEDQLPEEQEEEYNPPSLQEIDEGIKGIKEISGKKTKKGEEKKEPKEEAPKEGATEKAPAEKAPPEGKIVKPEAVAETPEATTKAPEAATGAPADEVTAPAASNEGLSTKVASPEASAVETGAAGAKAETEIGMAGAKEAGSVAATAGKTTGTIAKATEAVANSLPAIGIAAQGITGGAEAGGSLKKAASETTKGNIGKAEEKAEDALLTAGKTAADIGSAIAAPETGGLSLLVPAVTTLITKGYQFLRKYRWWFLAAIFFMSGGFIFLLIYYTIFSHFHTDTSDTQNQALISDVTNLAASDKITFESPDDLSKIKDGEIGLNSLKMIKYLASKHDGLTIHYSGAKDVSDPDKKENAPSEFDITAVDKIKCTDTATKNKSVEFPISLNPKFDWQSQIPTGSINSVICAVSYYPMIEAPVKGPYADKFGPGEFKLAELTTFAPMASQEKTAELTNEIISANLVQGIDPNSEDSLLPQKIEIPKIYADSNLAHSGGGVPEELKSKIDEVYQNKNEYEGVAVSDDSIGLHISFL